MDDSEMQAEYRLDPAKGERGKFFKLRRDRGAMFVLIEPDIAAYFEDAAAVNDALRGLIDLSRKSTESNGHQKQRTAKAATQPVKAR